MSILATRSDDVTFLDGRRVPTWAVPSASRIGVTHLVRRLADDTIICTCERAQLARVPCRHMRLVQRLLIDANGGEDMSITTTTQPRTDDIAIGAIEAALAQGDLSKLSPEDRTRYLLKVCQSLGLNPLTRPLLYVVLSNKLTLYATRDATDQLRKLHGVSVRILSRERIEDLYLVHAEATDKTGRTDSSLGAVSIKGLSGEALANAIMKSECVPLDSEILTRDGFKTYDAVSAGDEVLAYDLEADACVWTPLLEVTTYRDAPVSSLASTEGQFRVVCTPDHSWAIKTTPYRARTRGDVEPRGPRGPYRSRGPARKLVEANRINTASRIILAAPEPGPTEDESLLTPVEAALLGWAVTDGTIHRRGSYVRLGICQSKTANFAVIRETVGAAVPGFSETVTPGRPRTFPMTGRTYDTLDQHWWYLPTAISKAILERAGFHDRSDLPRIVTRLSSAARKAMLQAFMLAEGDARGIFANGDRNILEAFDILCALEGAATGQLKTKDTIWTKRLKKTKHVAGSFLTLAPSGTADVWCPTTSYGTWVMRQNGRVMITGNTKAKRRVTLSICGLGMLDETEVQSVLAIEHQAPALGAGESGVQADTVSQRPRLAAPQPSAPAPGERPDFDAFWRTVRESGWLPADIQSAAVSQWGKQVPHLSREQLAELRDAVQGARLVADAEGQWSITPIGESAEEPTAE